MMSRVERLDCADNRIDRNQGRGAPDTFPEPLKRGRISVKLHAGGRAEIIEKCFKSFGSSEYVTQHSYCMTEGRTSE